MIRNGNAGPGVEFHRLGFHHKDHLPTRENRYEKNGLGSDEFDQYAIEYRPGEYLHKMLQPCKMYGRIFHLWLPVS